MPRRKRFLILTSDSGFGHRRAADSVARALALRYADCTECAVLNPIREETLLHLLKQTEHNYDRNVTDNVGLYRISYSISNSRAASTLVENSLVLALSAGLKNVLRQYRPDAILNTSQLFNAPAGSARDILRPLPALFTVVTDLADLHSLWFNPSPDRFFVATADAEAKAIADGIPPGKITVSGIPVDPDFRAPPADRFELRRRLTLVPDLPTLLIVGSRRVPAIPEYLDALEEVRRPFQAVVLAGGDLDLYKTLRLRRRGFPLLVRPYASDMAHWMHSADVLVTKAGGLVLSEGLAAGLPILLIHSLPGQEDGNVRYVTEHGAGVRVDAPREFAGRADAWLRDGGAAARPFAENSRRLGHPLAALTIADELFAAAGESAGEKVPPAPVPAGGR
jgi:1,2-diacylglycerol 3-beta-galactosyltransferase